MNQPQAAPSPPSASRVASTQVELRVGYADCDPQNMAHHSVYPVWLEIARTELLRRQGVAYRALETQGVFFVVARMSLRYHRPARYDDLIQIEVSVERSAGVKVEHQYQVRRGDEVLCSAQTTLVCLDRQGNLRPVPDFMA